MHKKGGRKVNQEQKGRIVEKGKPDIWDEGIKNHCAKAKLSLLCYIDEMLPQAKNSDEKDRLGRIKARIHNELSQLSVDMRILFTCMKAGADITPLGDEIIRRSNNSDYRSTKRRPSYNNLPNPVLQALKDQ